MVGVFPVTDSYIRLVTSYLLECPEDWQCYRSCIHATSIKIQRELLFEVT